MLSLQTAYEDQASLAHRKRYGQFFTPSAVAKFMVNWVLESECKEIFDPGVGLGAFFDCVQCAPEIRTYGMELGFRIHQYCMDKNGKETRNRMGNYLLTWERKYENIVCNPPMQSFTIFRGGLRYLKNLRTAWAYRCRGT